MWGSLLLSMLLVGACAASITPTYFEEVCNTCECKCERRCASRKQHEADEPNSEAGHSGNSGYPDLYSTQPSPCAQCAKDNLALVNNYRMQFGMPDVAWSDRLAKQASAHSKEMFDRHSLYHSNYGGWENVAYSSGSTSWSEVANSLFEQWRHSPGHNQNMLLPSHGCAGVGIYGDGTTFYGTQIFSNQCQ